MHCGQITQAQESPGSPTGSSTGPDGVHDGREELEHEHGGRNLREALRQPRALSIGLTTARVSTSRRPGVWSA